MGLAQANLFYGMAATRGWTTDSQPRNGRWLSIRQSQRPTCRGPGTWRFAAGLTKPTVRSRRRFGLTLTAGRPTRKPPHLLPPRQARRGNPAPGKGCGAGQLRFPQSGHADCVLPRERRLSACSRVRGKDDRADRNVLVRDPDNGAALAFLALGYAALGQLERAQQYVERALLLDPDISTCDTTSLGRCSLSSRTRKVPLSCLSRRWPELGAA